MNRPIRVLVVEDRAPDAELMIGELERAGFDPLWKRVETEERYLAELQNPPEIILSDYSLPSFDGLRAVDLLRARGLDIPFILVSGTLGEEAAVEALKRGATDYLLKDRIACLGLAVTRALEEHRQGQERVRTECKLRLAHEQLEQLLARSPAVIYSLKLAAEGTVPALVSENISRVLGFSPEECLQPDWWAKQVHPEDWARAQAEARETLSRGQTIRRYRLRHQDGSYRWVEDSQRLVRDEAGRAQEIVGVWTDITARQQAEEAMNTLRRQNELILGSAGEGIHGIDVAGKIIFENVAAAKMLGWDRDELIGRAAHQTIHHSRADGTPYPLEECPIHATMRDGRPRRVDRDVFWRKDGTSFPVEYTTNAMRDETGNTIGTVVVFADVTERHRLEERFRQSQKMEAIGQLAGGVAHDFNNILTAMMIQIELTNEREELSPNLRAAFVELRAAAERAAGLTRQLLLFSRRQVMQPRLLNLNEVVSGLINMLRRIIGEDIRIETRLHPASLLAYADQGMLDQVLMNLAINARDAMPSGGRLLIETGRKEFDDVQALANPETAPGRYLWLSVSDTGSGIPPEIRPHIFEPFFTTKTPGKGTGLGLATVFGIVKQHRGWIKVYSEPGQGANFQIFLPASEGATVPEAVPQTPLRGGTETILLAEDDVAVRKLTSAILKRYGYQVIEAASGLAARRIWQEHGGKIDLLLTDLVMPDGMSGWELARSLQAEKPDFKTVFTSGYSAEIAGREIKLRVGENFVQKPAPPRQLLETVRRCLDA